MKRMRKNNYKHSMGGAFFNAINKGGSTMAIKCTCGREYTQRQAAKGFVGKINGEKCCIRCADRRGISIIEKKVFGITL